MSGLFWTDGETRLKTFSSSTTSKGRTTFKIELETDDPFAAASILRQLGEVRDEQAQTQARPKAAEREAPRASARRPATRTGTSDEAELPYDAPLMIEYQRGRSS